MIKKILGVGSVIGLMLAAVPAEARDHHADRRGHHHGRDWHRNAWQHHHHYQRRTAWNVHSDHGHHHGDRHDSHHRR